MDSKLPGGKIVCLAAVTKESAHGIIALFVPRKLILQTLAQPPSGARCLIVGRTLRLLP